MKRSNLSPLTISIILLGIVVCGILGWRLHDAKERARIAQSQWRQKIQERTRLINELGPAHAPREESVRATLASAQARLAELRSSLIQGFEVAVPNVSAPKGTVDVYLDLASARERWRELAADAQVAVRDDEHFGFASHAAEGPAPELIPSVMRQQQLAQRLLAALFAAKPSAFHSLQRERPLTAAERDQRNRADEISRMAATDPPARSNDDPADFFQIDASRSARIAGRVESEAFRLEFTGQTTTLRSFLTALRMAHPPIIVRAVEVGPGEVGFRNVVGMHDRNSAELVTVIPQSSSRFSVTVECIELVVGEVAP